MADIEIATGNNLWSGILSVGIVIMGYFLKQKDERLTSVEKKTDDLKDVVLKDYATKESLRMLFQETQNSARQTAERLEKQIDETKAAVTATNVKIDNMQTASNTKIDTVQSNILTAIASKKD